MSYSNRIRHLRVALCSVLLLCSVGVWAGMMPDPMQTISYQGQLKNAGQPFTGEANMAFSLWDQQSGGSQIGQPWFVQVDVVNGLFMADLYFDFPQWDQPMFLQVTVEGEPLSSRQRIAPTPVAIFGLDGPGSGGDTPWTVSGSHIYYSAGNVGIGTSSTPQRLNVLGNIALTGWLGHSMPAGTPLPFVVSGQTAMRYRSGTSSPNILGGSLENQINAGASGSVIAGGGQAGSFNAVSGNFSSVGGGRGNSLTGDLGVIGGGLENVIQAGSTQSVVSGGFSNFINADWSSIGGGWSNGVFADYGAVAGGRVNIISAEATHSFVGGGENNWIQQGPSASLARWAAIGGGQNNRAYSNNAFIGAGESNVADGARAFIGAGNGNEVTGGNSSVAGGTSNSASGLNTFVGGGSSNVASGSQAMIIGGSQNIAEGQRSFAGGRRAEALHNGAFVWADSTTTTVQSTAANQFTAQASGGVRFFSNAALTTGVQLAANGGSWSSLSDRHAKRDFTPVDSQAVLARLMELPVMTWRYMGQGEETLHMGPVAQDFHAAFGLGGDELRIATIDADGVALAAIQGLYLALTERDQRIDQLEAELASLRQHTLDRIAALESLLLASDQQLALEDGR